MPISALVLFAFLLAGVSFLAYVLTWRRYKVLLWLGGIIFGLAFLLILYFLIVILILGG